MNRTMMNIQITVEHYNDEAVASLMCHYIDEGIKMLKAGEKVKEVRAVNQTTTIPIRRQL